MFPGVFLVVTGTMVAAAGWVGASMISDKHRHPAVDSDDQPTYINHHQEPLKVCELLTTEATIIVIQ